MSSRRLSSQKPLQVKKVDGDSSDDGRRNDNSSDSFDDDELASIQKSQDEQIEGWKQRDHEKADTALHMKKSTYKKLSAEYKKLKNVQQKNEKKWNRKIVRKKKKIVKNRKKK